MKSTLLFLLLGLLVAALWTACLAYGTVPIPPLDVVRILLGRAVEPTAWTTIVLESRLPQAVTALLVGASLSVDKAESSGAAASADAPADAGKPNPVRFADAARADAAESREPAEEAAAEAKENAGSENAGSEEASAREGSAFPIWKADCLTASLALLSSEAPSS